MPTYESADVHATVTSHRPMTGLPACHGIRVIPSGRLPSVRDKAVGSFVTGMPAEVKALAMTLYYYYFEEIKADAKMSIENVKVCTLMNF